MDPDDDGVFDLTPWNTTTGVLDSVALVQTPTNWTVLIPLGVEQVYDLLSQSSYGLKAGPVASTTPSHVY